MQRCDPWRISFLMRKTHHYGLGEAARSWGGSAVLGVSPMSDCRGSPHSRFAVVSPTRALHQDRKSELCLGSGHQRGYQMHVISYRRLREFSEKHADCHDALDNWYKIANQATWSNLVEVQSVFRKAEAVGNFTVFNIKGNKYRLIVSIDYEKHLIYIKYILNHAEYDYNNWKNDPYF
ncbi:type II toxin-antitoxin system HigB family toxin [Moorena producens JHB]|uniref:Type II toxin-antitoxin system HigB family toxin n=4 Tax=Moorena TaxID=1155738 RepID=A0A9Q9SSH7_MOOP1|nr:MULTISPECIES: type II toxin-antitoxin system HigB family toxin [Moorena]WAN68844.1 type II toxin-antitoxin system HigB family toxin [Moorena producens JHB]